jgi:hypothetical protein
MEAGLNEGEPMRKLGRNFPGGALVGPIRGELQVRRALHRAVERWLQVELGGPDSESERALVEVFARLPGPILPQGFADTVLVRAGLIPARSPEPSWATIWGLRAALSLCLALGALSLLMLPSVLPAVLGIVNPGKLAEFGLAAVVGGIQRLGVGLVVWRGFSSVGEVLSSVVSTPRVLAALGGSALLSIGAFRVLQGLILYERSSHYVSSA